MKRRIAKALHRAACRLCPLPPLNLVDDAIDVADAIQGTLLDHGVSLSVTILPCMKYPAPDGLANVASIRPAAARPPAKKKSTPRKVTK